MRIYGRVLLVCLFLGVCMFWLVVRSVVYWRLDGGIVERVKGYGFLIRGVKLW